MRRVLIASLAIVVLMSSLGGGTVTSEPLEPTDHLLVEVDPNGDATVTLITVIDLTDEAAASAFEALADDPSTVDRLQTAYTDGLATVAAETAATVDRPMTIEAKPARFEVEGTIGIVALSVRWTGFATVTSDGFVIDEPFASGYVADRPIYLTAPTGYTISVDAPATVDDGVAVWPAGTDLTDASATVHANANPTTNQQTGATITIAGVALMLSALILGRRRDRT